MKYDLERLGPFGFQDLVSALALKVLGAQVQRMGAGRDGGRDMLVTNSQVVWATDGNSTGEVWAGTTVFQAKHKATLEGPPRDVAWVWTEIRKELDAWSALESDRPDVPDFLLFATNVPLTPFPEKGGWDTIHRKIRKYLADLDDGSAEDHLPNGPDRRRARKDREARRDRMARLKKWRVWDGNQFDGLLDAHEGVRRAFAGFLTAGDVLASLSTLSATLSSDELGPALRSHARWALIEERNVYFDEAGGDARGVPVEQVAVDLPVSVGGSTGTFRIIRHVLDRGDQVLRPSLATLGLPRHLVVTGAPGNGKTTVSKFLVHAYRAALLNEETDLADQQRKAINGTLKRLQSLGRAAPAHRRWPFRIDLATFAKRKATDEQYTLLSWVSDTLSRQVSTKGVPKWSLHSWLKVWPSFMVLDGLDEVTEPTVRKKLLGDVEAFVAEAEANDFDMLVVVTTRPTGYVGELDEDVFQRVDLADLSVRDALSYGRLVTRVRIPDDQSRRAGIEALLDEAARSEALRHLLRTPLQVLIMSIIAETSRQFAPTRYSLFWRYYQVIEAREQTKPLGYSGLLRDHSQQVLDLHRRVGLLLQERAETADGGTAALSPDDLRGVAWQVLADADYDPSGVDAGLLTQILTAVTHRLVLLAPRGDGGFGFDVRSLQELMAALELTTGALDDVLSRLRVIAASPHWRNTLLFAAGRFFADPQPIHQRAVTEMVLTVDENAPGRLGEICPVGPLLAWEIVDDGMAAQIPKWLNPLVDHGLKALGEPPSSDASALARLIVRAASRSDVVRVRIGDGLRDALGGTSVRRINAEQLQDLIRQFNKGDTLPADVVGLAGIRRDPGRGLPPDPVPDWAAFDETMRSFGDESSRELLEAAMESIHTIASHAQQSTASALVTVLRAADPVSALLKDGGEPAEILQLALLSVAAGEPALVAALRDSIVSILWRQPTSSANTAV